jgi:hypothetical protein
MKDRWLNLCDRETQSTILRWRRDRRKQATRRLKHHEKVLQAKREWLRKKISEGYYRGDGRGAIGNQRSKAKRKEEISQYNRNYYLSRVAA